MQSLIQSQKLPAQGWGFWEHDFWKQFFPCGHTVCQQISALAGTELVNLKCQMPTHLTETHKIPKSKKMGDGKDLCLWGKPINIKLLKRLRDHREVAFIFCKMSKNKCPVLWASSYRCTYTCQLAFGHGCSSWQESQIRVSMQAQAWSWNIAETNRKGGRTAKAPRSALLALYSNIVQTQTEASQLNFVYNRGSK